jgi:predicted helicase
MVTSRDAWVYNFSIEALSKNVRQMISYYNEERTRTNKVESIKSDLSQISWSVNLKNDLKNNYKHSFNEVNIINSNYRPFVKSRIYFDRKFIERPGFNDKFFPKNTNNFAIGITGNGSSKDFSVLITSTPFDFQTLMNGLIFPQYFYEENNAIQKGMFDEDNKNDYIRRDAISDFILERANNQYGTSTSLSGRISKEDIFYYVYGLLHSKEYIEMFANDLKKMLPRLPLLENVKDFWAFSKAGRKLAELHLNYETVAPFADAKVTGDASTGSATQYVVEKLRFPKKDQKETIIYNSKITISNIPAQAYEYVVNGKSAIEWIMERYQVTTHKESGIVNNPNDWSAESGNPRYILDLLLSVINVSVQTVDIVNSLPNVKFE